MVWCSWRWSRIFWRCYEICCSWIVWDTARSFAPTCYYNESQSFNRTRYTCKCYLISTRSLFNLFMLSMNILVPSQLIISENIKLLMQLQMFKFNNCHIFFKCKLNYLKMSSCRYETFEWVIYYVVNLLLLLFFKLEIFSNLLYFLAFFKEFAF